MHQSYFSNSNVVLLQALGISVVGFFCCLLISSPLFYFTRLETIFLDASYCYEVTCQKCHIKILLFILKYVNDYTNKSSCRIGQTSWWVKCILSSAWYFNTSFLAPLFSLPTPKCTQSSKNPLQEQWKWMSKNLPGNSWDASEEEEGQTYF